MNLAPSRRHQLQFIAVCNKFGAIICMNLTPSRPARNADLRESRGRLGSRRRAAPRRFPFAPASRPLSVHAGAGASEGGMTGGARKGGRERRSSGRAGGGEREGKCKPARPVFAPTPVCIAKQAHKNISRLFERILYH